MLPSPPQAMIPGHFIVDVGKKIYLIGNCINVQLADPWWASRVRKT